MSAEARAERPHMPDYGIHTDRDGLLDWQFVSERMEAARNYWVASSGQDGRPHVAPVWGLWHQGAFFFSTGDESRKARNLNANPAAVVHLESGDEVVILEGVMEVEKDKATMGELNDLYQEKYGYPIADDGLVYRLRHQKAFAWREADFPSSATRWSFD